MKLKSILSVVYPLSCLLLMHPASATAGEKKPAKKSRTSSSPRNNQAIKISPDALKRTMHVTAKDNDGKEIDFFVFDLEGTLVKHFRMTEGDKEEIAGLARGKYLYNVFAGDEEAAAGQFEIR